MSIARRVALLGPKNLNSKSEERQPKQIQNSNRKRRNDTGPDARRRSRITQRASVCRTDADTQAQNECVRDLASGHQNDVATSRPLWIETARVDVTSARKQDAFRGTGGVPSEL